MILKIKSLKKEDIKEVLNIALKTGASCNRKEAQKIMSFSLAPGIKPFNPNYYVLTLSGKIIGISGL